jgi:hypothetical protein
VTGLCNEPELSELLRRMVGAIAARWKQRQLTVRGLVVLASFPELMVNSEALIQLDAPSHLFLHSRKRLEPPAAQAGLRVVD